MHRLVPATRGVPIADGWGGAVDRSPDGLPFFGSLSGGGIPVHYCAGLSGNGVAPSLLAGRVLCSLALRSSDAWSECGLARGVPGRFPPSPSASAAACSCAMPFAARSPARIAVCASAPSPAASSPSPPRASSRPPRGSRGAPSAGGRSAAASGRRRSPGRLGWPPPRARRAGRAPLPTPGRAGAGSARSLPHRGRWRRRPSPPARGRDR